LSGEAHFTILKAAHLVINILIMLMISFRPALVDAAASLAWQKPIKETAGTLAIRRKNWFDRQIPNSGQELASQGAPMKNGLPRRFTPVDWGRTAAKVSALV